MKIAVIFGGCSKERNVSINSAKSIIDSLTNSYDIYPVKIENNYADLVSKLKKIKIDIVFNALHGGEGENGTIQKIFDEEGILYTGSGTESSKLAMDKNRTKKICLENNIPTPDWEYYNLSLTSIDNIGLKRIINRFNGSYVVKPSNEGSSFGLKIIENDFSEKTLINAINSVSSISKEILIERYIDGRELTVSILDGKSLPIIEIVPKSSFYDFNSKYVKGGSEYIVPAILDAILVLKIKKYAEKLYKKINCDVYSRVDIILNDNKINILELNTLPGFTSTSLLPMAAKEAGISYKKLLKKIIRLSMPWIYFNLFVVRLNKNFLNLQAIDVANNLLFKII